jgi:hypothetical protein
MPGYFLARSRFSSSLSLSGYPGEWLRVAPHPSLTLCGSKTEELICRFDGLCPCPECYIYASKPCQFSELFLSDTHIVAKAPFIEQDRLWFFFFFLLLSLFFHWFILYFLATFSMYFQHMPLVLHPPVSAMSSYFSSSSTGSSTYANSMSTDSDTWSRHRLASTGIYFPCLALSFVLSWFFSLHLG